MARLLADRILIQPDEAITETPSGIVIAGAEENPPTTGTIILAGPEVDGVGEGDRVQFASYGGQDIEYEGRMCVLMRPNDIYLVLEADEG